MEHHIRVDRHLSVGLASLLGLFHPVVWREVSREFAPTDFGLERTIVIEVPHIDMREAVAEFPKEPLDPLSHLIVTRPLVWVFIILTGLGWVDDGLPPASDGSRSDIDERLNRLVVFQETKGKTDYAVNGGHKEVIGVGFNGDTHRQRRWPGWHVWRRCLGQVSVEPGEGVGVGYFGMGTVGVGQMDKGRIDREHLDWGTARQRRREAGDCRCVVRRTIRWARGRRGIALAWIGMHSYNGGPWGTRDGRVSVGGRARGERGIGRVCLRAHS